MRGRAAETAHGIGTVDGMADLGEKDRMRHRRVVEFLGVMVLFHPEGAEAAVRSLIGGKTRRHRPAVTLDAVDGDGHLLVVLVDCYGDFGLGGARGEQRQGGDGNEEGTHFTFGLQAPVRSAGSPSPASNMPGNRHWFQWPASAIVNASHGANKAAA